MSLAPNPITVLVVDDSPFMRMTIQKILSQNAGIKVVDTARDGREGIQKLQALRPQVVTMDVEMPVMDGLQALDEIMRWQPTPVIILSAVTTEGAQATLKALDLGAFDVVAKPSGGPGADLKTLGIDLVEKVCGAAGVDMRRLKPSGYGTVGSASDPAGPAGRGTGFGSTFGAGLSKATGAATGSALAAGSGTSRTGIGPSVTGSPIGSKGQASSAGGAGTQNASGAGIGTASGNSLSAKGSVRGGSFGASPFPKHPVEIVAIGTSTGGPSALQAVLPQLPADFPVPVLVAQHMPPGFTGPLAQRLNTLCPLEVREGVHDEVLQQGTIYVAPAGKQLQVIRRGGALYLHIGDEVPIQTLYHPSVDVMFLSLAKEVGKGALGVVMTGMGSDGTKGMRDIKSAEGFSIAEAEETCVVYGMPRSIIDAGLADRITPLGEIGRAIVECVMRR